MSYDPYNDDGYQYDDGYGYDYDYYDEPLRKKSAREERYERYTARRERAMTVPEPEGLVRSVLDRMTLTQKVLVLCAVVVLWGIILVTSGYWDKPVTIPPEVPPIGGQPDPEDDDGEAPDEEEEERELGVAIVDETITNVGVDINKALVVPGTDNRVAIIPSPDSSLFQIGTCILGLGAILPWCEQTVPVVVMNEDAVELTLADDVFPEQDGDFDLPFFKALLEKDACNALTREEAKLYLCQRGLHRSSFISSAFGEALRLSDKQYRMEVSDEYGNAWKGCLANIARTHFSTPVDFISSTLGIPGRLGGGRTYSIPSGICEVSRELE